MKYLPLVFLGSALTLGLHGGPAAPGDSGIGLDLAVSEVANALAKAEKVQIYQGLPRDRNEFEHQKAANICRQITDQWFYSLPREAKFEHVLDLQRLFDFGLLQPWRGGKFCGGFHADWAVACTTGKSTLYVLFCFGCHEGRIVREGKPFAADLREADFRATADLNGKYFEELRTLLAAYRQEHPASAK